MEAAAAAAILKRLTFKNRAEKFLLPLTLNI
jgi:hypothetical protein